MELIDEIFKLSIMKPGSVLPIKQGNDITYLCRSLNSYSVAIHFDDARVFNESFVGITLSTNMLNYNQQSFKVLYLNMNDTGDLKKFSYVAAEFLDIANRASILQNPYLWVDAWNEIFGNAKKKYMISDVIAELSVLKEIYKADKTAKWMGPRDGTHDIVVDDGTVEVKSTTNKINTYVSINSRFQISAQKNEKLFFVRLEAKPYAESIDSLVQDLVCLGYNQGELEESLKYLGYRKGNRTRKQTYDILSMLSYNVTVDNFPIIKLEDLNNLSSTKNIVGFKLMLDLSTIPHTRIK